MVTRDFTRILLTLTVSLSATATCVAQKESRPQQSPPATLRRESVTIDEPPGGAIYPDEVKKIGGASVLYYKGLDQTIVTAGPGEVFHREQVSVTMFCSFDSKGRQIVRPNRVDCHLTSGWVVFDKGDRMEVELDGKHFEFALQPGLPLPGGQVNVSLDFKSFEQIVNGTNVKVRVGRIDFRLDGDRREALRDLLRAIETPSK